MTPVAEKVQPWLGSLDGRPQGGPRWLQDLRERGAARFAALGFPTVRDEDWRFTSVAPIAAGDFRAARPAAAPSEEQLSRFVYANAAHRLVLVNGTFAPEVSRTNGLPAGVRFGSLATAMQEDTDPIARYLGQLAELNQRPFSALNTAFARDGAFILIPDGLVLEAPLQVIFVSSMTAGAETKSADGESMTSPRMLVLAGDRSQSRIVETYAGFAGQRYFTNAVTEVVVGEGAVVDHYKVLEESVDAFHVASTHFHASAKSTFSSHSFLLGGRLVRNDVMALLDGEGAECTLNGLYLADGERLVDTHTTIDHARPHCPSHEVYKGILGGRARAVFNGKIIVRQDAQKTDAKQTNRALLLTDDALINTKPQLEIFADDVKCTHGAAIGQLDDDAIFYLRARGLTFFEARDMLIHAFAGQILERVKVEPLKTALESELYARLARDLAEVDGK